MKRTLKVALIARDALFGEGLLRILRSTSYRVAAITASVSQLRISTSDAPALVILAPSEEAPNWADLIAEVQLASRTAKVVVVAEAADVAAGEELLRAGATAYLHRSITTDLFVKALDLVSAGETVISPALVRHLLFGEKGRAAVERSDNESSAARPADEIAKRLSLREAEILECIVRGDSNKHIGRRFQIAETTVKVHVKSILRKINVRNRTQAAIWAFNHHGFDSMDQLQKSATRLSGNANLPVYN